jgi:hypothetical protein
MVKLYKKIIPLIGVAQLMLFLIILTLGVFSYNFYSYGSHISYYGFYSNRSTIITIFYQFVFYASIFNPLRQLFLDKVKRVKLLSALSFIFYALLITLYIVVRIEWIFGGYIYTSNEVGNVLGVFWIVSLIIFFIPFLSSLIVMFIAPRYKNKIQLQLQKTRISKEASNNIRDLKKLLDEGIISKEVFDEKSKKYIEEL